MVPAPSADEAAGRGRRLVGCGHAWLASEIAVVDPERGTEVPPEQVGEIWIAGAWNISLA